MVHFNGLKIFSKIVLESLCPSGEQYYIKVIILLIAMMLK